MTTRRLRTADWTVSPVLVVAGLLGIAAIVVVVKVGADDQRNRSIPHVLSATVAVERPGQPTAHGALTQNQANMLAGLINRVGQAPSHGGCGEIVGSGDVITFASSGGLIVVDVTRCSDVSISSHGQDWGANKYDWNGVIEPALQRDLPGIPWDRLDAPQP